MKKIGVFFNSPYLGGAERSMIYQLSFICKDRSVDVWLPYINQKDEAREIVRLLNENGINNNSIFYIQYPEKLFSVSRQHIFINLFSLLISIFVFISRLKVIPFNSYDVIWCNGNKISFPICLMNVLRLKRFKIVWHFRDFPPENGIFKIVINIFGKLLYKNLFAVGNSLSVCKSIEKHCSFYKVFPVYNPVGVSLSPRSSQRHYNTIGLMSMFANWKGVHHTLLFFSIYKEKLRSLGFHHALVFGDEIYKTKGNHVGIKSLYKNLVSKLDSDDFISFEGLCSPSKALSEIDVLIHSSIKPEPFGRVLIEAFASNVSVVSTCLGGAGELIGESERGDNYILYDYEGLFQKIKSIATDLNTRSSKLEKAKSFAENLDTLISSQFEQLLKSL